MTLGCPSAKPTVGLACVWVLGVQSFLPSTRTNLYFDFTLPGALFKAPHPLIIINPAPSVSDGAGFSITQIFRYRASFQPLNYRLPESAIICRHCRPGRGQCPLTVSHDSWSEIALSQTRPNRNIFRYRAVLCPSITNDSVRIALWYFLSQKVQCRIWRRASARLMMPSLHMCISSTSWSRRSYSRSTSRPHSIPAAGSRLPMHHSRSANPGA